MKKLYFPFLIVFISMGYAFKAQTNLVQSTQNNLIVNHWYEAPESSHGDTIVFKTTKHALGPNEDPAYAFSDFTVKSDNTFDIAYWRWCPTGNYTYSGTWSTLASNKVLFDFGAGKCKCEMKIISVTANLLTATLIETTN